MLNISKWSAIKTLLANLGLKQQALTEASWESHLVFIPRAILATIASVSKALDPLVQSSNLSQLPLIAGLEASTPDCRKGPQFLTEYTSLLLHVLQDLAVQNETLDTFAEPWRQAKLSRKWPDPHFETPWNARH